MNTNRQGVFYILQKDTFNTIYVLDNYKYALWTDRYDDCGDFEIQVVPSPGLMSVIQEDNYVVNNDATDDTRVMIIETIDTVADDSGEILVKISGRSTESILDRRIIGIKTIFRNNLEDGLKQIIKHCFYDLNFSGHADGIYRPSDFKIYNMGFEYSRDSYINNLNIDNITFDRGTNVLDIVKSIAQSKDLGFKMPLYEYRREVFVGDYLPNSFIFSLGKYTDRSDSIVFSRNMDNLASSDYKKSTEQYRNVVYLYGKKYDPSGSGSSQDDSFGNINDREIGGTGENPTGLYVREAVNYASGVDWKVTDIYGTETTLSGIEYVKLIVSDGYKLLKDKKVTEESDVKIIENNGFVYNKDFFIGDLVGFIDEFGNFFKMQVCEYILSYDQNGIIGYPKFRVFKSNIISE